MSSKDLRLLLNRSLTDKDFRETLLQKPEEALEKYNLRQTEREAILRFCSDNFTDLVSWLRYLELVGVYDDIV